MKGSLIMTNKASQAIVDTLTKEKVAKYYVYSSPPKGKAPNNKMLPLGKRSPPPYVRKMFGPMHNGKPAKKMKKLPLHERKLDIETDFDDGSDGVPLSKFFNAKLAKKVHDEQKESKATNAK